MPARAEPPRAGDPAASAAPVDSERICWAMAVDRPTALALALARLSASASPKAHSGRSAAPRPVTSRSRRPCMQKATGPWVVWKFLAMSG